MTKYIFIVNPKAGSGTAGKVWPKLDQALKDSKLDFESHLTEYDDHAISLTRELAITNAAENNHPIFVVVGGDGTVNQVLNGLRLANQPQTPIGYFPAGSGNDFARSLHLTQDIGTFITNLTHSSQATILNIFKATIATTDKQLAPRTKYLINNFGMGFDAHVVHLTEHSNRKEKLNRWHLGHLSYVINLFSVLKNQNSFAITVKCDNKVESFKKAYLTTMTNIAYFGGGVKIMPTADPHQSELDLVVIEKPSLIYFLGLFVLVLTNGHHLRSKSVHVFKSTTKISVSCQPAQFGQMDGEDMGKHEFKLTVNNDKHPFWI